jgi:uncharacterized damage-inducible protein DinB
MPYDTGSRPDLALEADALEIRFRSRHYDAAAQNRRIQPTAILRRMTATPSTQAGSLLDALLDSWDRNNTILTNLLRALPHGALDLSAADGSPTVAQLFTHIHYVRLVFVVEDAPEFAKPVPNVEWAAEPDRDRIAEMLSDSARAVRDAVKGRLQAARDMDRHYDHPILMLQHMIWHEGYHHGQIKLALKAAGRPFDDEEIGQVTWDVWLQKGQWS